MRYLITGGSGYIGSRLTEILAVRDETERIVNVDIQAPRSTPAKATYHRGDIRDRVMIRNLLQEEEIDCLLHLAFVFSHPIHDEAKMYDVDVNGTEGVLRSASEAGTEQVLVTSSASAYGAFPDNPRPIAEDWPVRGVADFSYPRDKAEADRICQVWAADHPDRVMTIVRPCIVFSPKVDNFISEGWEKFPTVLLPDGVDEEIQFVHEEDVVSAIASLLDARAPGAFNVAGDGTITYRQCAELIGKKVREMPFKRAYRIAQVLWKLRLPQGSAPPGAVRFLRYPWIVSTEKLKATTGWAPKYRTREVFEETMRAKGKLAAAGAPSAAATVGARSR